MDISFLASYFVPVVVGICLCTGYVIHQFAPDAANKYIPACMALEGVLIAVWVQGGVTPDVLLGGMVSGLASTGMWELFKQLIQPAATTATTTAPVVATESAAAVTNPAPAVTNPTTTSTDAESVAAATTAATADTTDTTTDKEA